MPERISTGTAELDKLLDGGYEKDIITTMYGPGGCGKTNLCLLCSVSVAGNKKVIFVDTEGSFSVERVKQITPDYAKLSHHILVLKPTSFEEQKKVISELKKVDDKVGLIVVDTIVALYRVERSRSESYELNRELGLQISHLNEIARKKHIPVLLSSQVYSSINGTDELRMVGGDLLNYASKCIIELQNLDGGHRLILRKHRSIQPRTMDFRIVERGIREIER